MKLCVARGCHCHAAGYFFSRGCYEWEDVGGDYLVAGGGGVGAVALHHAGDSVDVLEEEGEERSFVFGGEQRVGGVELLDVVGAVVGRESDAGEDYFCAGGFEGGDDVVEVGAGVFDAETAEAVVAAELNDCNGGVEGEDGGEALNAVLGGGAADAEVDDAVFVALPVEIGLEVVGVALAGVGAIAGGEGVAEADEERAMVVRVDGRRVRRRWGRIRGRRLVGGDGLRLVCSRVLGRARSSA